MTTEKNTKKKGMEIKIVYDSQMEDEFGVTGAKKGSF